MKNLEKLQPTHIAATVEAISPESLLRTELGYIDTVAFDVDGTLMDYHKSDLEPRVHRCLTRLSQAGMNLYVVSNAYDERVEELSRIFKTDEFDMTIITPASISKSRPKEYRKPSPAMLNRVIELSGSNVLMVGDQMMKDILSANNAKVASVLVPRRGDGDDWRVRKLQRPLEARIGRHLGLPDAAEFPAELTEL